MYEKDHHSIGNRDVESERGKILACGGDSHDGVVTRRWMKSQQIRTM